MLEPKLAHKLGKHRHVGFGSLRLQILPDSFLIDWGERYASQPEREGHLPLAVNDWLKPAVIAHYAELQTALNAESL